MTTAIYVAVAIAVLIMFSRKIRSYTLPYLDQIGVQLVKSKTVNTAIQTLLPLFVTASSMIGVITETKANVKLIRYTISGKDYCIPLAFNRRSRGVVEVKYNFRHEESKTYRYPTGTSFTCSPNQLGCDTIEVSVDGKQTSYQGDEIPQI
jgi:hypothetical protein